MDILSTAISGAHISPGAPSALAISTELPDNSVLD